VCPGRRSHRGAHGRRDEHAAWRRVGALGRVGAAALVLSAQHGRARGVVCGGGFAARLCVQGHCRRCLRGGRADRVPATTTR
jgi:hypothetical protein